MSADPNKIIEHQPEEGCPQCGKHHTDEPIRIIGKRLVGGDESGVKVKKANLWDWTWQSLFATYIVISRNRGYATIEKTFPAGFPNATYVSDSLSAQLKTVAGRHQLCLAHLLRELNYFEEIYHHQWVIDMKDLLKRAIKLKLSIATEHYGEPLEERSEILREFKILINQPLPDKVPKIFPFQKRLVKRKGQVSNFLFYPDVPYDNNGSERAIRNVKVKQKVSGSFRSERGAEIFAILRSVVDTIIKKGGNPFESIASPLLLLPAKKNSEQITGSKTSIKIPVLIYYPYML